MLGDKGFKEYCEYIGEENKPIKEYFISPDTNGGDRELLTEDNKNSSACVEAKTWEHEEVTDYLSGHYANLGQDVMPIFGMWTPWDIDVEYKGQKIPNLCTEEMYQAVAETGVNVFWQGNEDYVNDPEKVKHALDLCAKNNVVLSVMDTYYNKWGAHANTGTFLLEDQTEIYVNQEQFTQRLKEYALHPGFGGLFFIDEPNPYIYPSYKKLTEMYFTALKELNAPYAPAYWNSLPSGYLTRNYKYDYDKHLQEFGLASGCICYDCYPFYWEMQDDFDVDWFKLNRRAYNVAKANNLPLGTYIATGGNWVGVWDDHSGVKPATIAQTVWQVNMFIANGGKQIHYYTVNQPISQLKLNDVGGELGMFDSFGTKTRYFYAAKFVNSQILSCDHILLKSTLHGGIFTGDKIYGGGDPKEKFGNLLEERKFRELVEVSENASSFVGCFDYQGKTMLYVVNNSWDQTAEITLGFDNTYAYEITQRAETVEVVGKKFTLKLLPGEGVMVRLK